MLLISAQTEVCLDRVLDRDCDRDPPGTSSPWADGCVGRTDLVDEAFLIPLYVTLFSSPTECWGLQHQREKKRKKRKKKITESACDEKPRLRGEHLERFLFTFHPAPSHGLQGNRPKCLPCLHSAPCFYFCLKTNSQNNKRFYFSWTPVLQGSHIVLLKFTSLNIKILLGLRLWLSKDILVQELSE